MTFSLSEKQRTELIVVDNFYESPGAIRELALKQEFSGDNRYFKGVRTSQSFATHDVRYSFEQLLGKTITKWDYEANGIFQICTAEDALVYHMDSQQWAAVIFLTPDAPVESGTSFFRSKETGIRGCLTRHGIDSEIANSVLSTTFRGGFYDRTQFEPIDLIGNIYNRLVIWDAKLIHAASQYFGQKKEDARLFQIFFFDAE